MNLYYYNTQELQMESIAQMSCALKVNPNCDGCKREVLEILQNVKGVYSVVIDSEQGTVKVNGKANPAKILKVFDKYGKHRKVSNVRFDGEVVEQHYYGQNFYLPYDQFGHVPYPQYFGGLDYYGRNPYLMPPPPLGPPMVPLHGLMPPPPPPPPPPHMFHDLSTPAPAQPAARPPTPAPSAPPPRQPHCCTIM